MYGIYNNRLYNALSIHNPITIIVNPSIDGLSNGLCGVDEVSNGLTQINKEYNNVEPYFEIERICYLCHQKCGLQCVKCSKVVCSNCSEFKFEKDYKDASILCKNCYTK